ncbi:MAG: hypothetical protein HY694_09810 [Deltaproteobacteria bacterium]|nr:hypothetical protein [Deltaproteobacteria bacterium]
MNVAVPPSSVAFIDAKTGWAVGYDGTILHTSDGGQTWNLQASKVAVPLSSVAFIDAKTGWAVGYGGTILHTSDGGQTWNLQASKRNEYLYSFTFVDAKMGWVVGDRGTILHTSDGGQTWILQASKTPDWLSSVAFVDAKTGWAAGDSGTILRTIDSGQTWNPQASSSKNPLHSVAFVDAKTGWAVGDRGTILHTSDGGQTWNTQASKVAVPLSSVAFVDAKTGWAAGDSGTILRTIDGGQTWNAITYRRYFAPWYYVSWLVILTLLVPALRKPDPVPESVPSIEAAMASDRPLRSGELDVLNLGQIAFALSRFLRNENTQPPLTIAITGDWGTGKSSLMNLLRDDLASYGVRPVWFNAWHHQKEEHLLASLLNAVHAQAIPPFLTLAGLKFRLKLAWGRMCNNPVTSVILGALLVIGTGYFAHEFPKRLIAIWGMLPTLNTSGETMSVDSAVKLLLGSFAGLTPLYGLYKILQPFGISPAVLLQNMSQGFTRRAAAQKTSFREQFSRDFKEVSAALNPRTMLILIDDLDRCRPDAVLEVMEGINFLVSSGDCFVVMGMARENVERAVGLSFKEIAKELVGEKYREAKPEQKEEYERRQRWQYGKHYLEKLVNLWVQVPPLTPATGGDLLARTTIQPQSAGSVWRVVKDFLVAAFGTLALGALLYVGSILPPVPPPSPDATKTTPPSTTTVSKPTPPITTPPGPVRDPGQPSSEVIRGPIFIPGDTDAPGLWWGVGGFVLLIGAGLILVFVRPQIVVPDSKNFKDALVIWDDVITEAYRTPRTLKRFMNNLRWLAARTRKNRPAPNFAERVKQAWQDIIGNRPLEEPGEIPEPVLVGLATLQAAGFNSRNGDIDQFLLSSTSLANNNLASGNVDAAYAQHCATAEKDRDFGNWPPTPEQVKRFFELLGDHNIPVTTPAGNGDKAQA